MRGEPSPRERSSLSDDWAEAVGRCFHEPDGTDPARIVLEQVADEYFTLRAGFRYAAHGDGTAIVVEPGDLGLTDLTSVPRALTWFVGRYGRHTPAALLHDGMIRWAERDAAEAGESPLPGYERADSVFLDALTCLEVPPLRRTTMWAAVSFGTRLRAGGWATAGIVAWLAAFLAGTAALLWGLADGHVGRMVIALLAPLAGAVLWGRQYWAGVVASYAAPFVAAPTLLGFVTFLAYRVLEWAILRLPGIHYEGTPYTSGW